MPVSESVTPRTARSRLSTLILAIARPKSRPTAAGITKPKGMMAGSRYTSMACKVNSASQPSMASRMERA